ncbi:MAG: hypothetical protein K2K09_00275, partial [Lachnospiraceae bacterium]|nr:hypothetical protein [Lachnospiraceae bacterium]
DKSPDTPVNNVPDATHIVRSGAFPDVYFYNAESVDEMIQFMNSPNSKTVNNGAFQNVAELYKSGGYMYVPAVLGLHTAISKVEICSNQSYMTFYFDKGRQVSVNPLSAEELELCNSMDSIQFLVNKKGVQMNEDQDVYLEYDGVKQDTVIGTMRWTEDSILVDGKETRCLMCMENSESGIISCVKAFIYNGFIVHVNNYSQQAIDTDFMKSVSFTKIQLNN